MWDKLLTIPFYLKNLRLHDKDKDFNKFKANYLFPYIIGLGVLIIFGSVSWILKDIFILRTDKIFLEIFLRILPCICAPFIYYTRNHKHITWISILVTLWVTIICNVFLDIFVNPGEGLSGEGWITYYVFFFAISIVANNQITIFISEILVTFVILITAEKFGGPIVYNSNILRPVTTGLILDIGLILASTTIRGSFIRLYENEVTLKNIAKQDTLTGTFNRHKLDDLIDDVGKFHRLSTVMIFDIDKFKEINDGYGHIAGDEAIKYASQVLTKSCRKNDFVVRFGGDEFVIILDGIVDTDIIWGKIKENLLNDNKYNVTFSAGSVKGDKDKDMYSLIKKADKGAYFSKEHGRNRLMKYEDLEMLEGKINGNN